MLASINVFRREFERFLAGFSPVSLLFPTVCRRFFGPKCLIEMDLRVTLPLSPVSIGAYRVSGIVDRGVVVWFYILSKIYIFLEIVLNHPHTHHATMVQLPTIQDGHMCPVRVGERDGVKAKSFILRDLGREFRRKKASIRPE